MTAADLAKECGIIIRKPDHFFDALVCLKMLERDESNLYSNTHLSEQFLNKNNYNTYFGAYISLTT